MDLVKFLKVRADRYNQKVLIYDEGASVSYRAFDEISGRMADGLEHVGVLPGDHVAVLHPNSSQVLLSYYAVIKAGGIVVPINATYTPREIAFILNDSQSKVLILHEDLSSKIEEIKGQIPLVKTMVVRKRNETVEMALEEKTGVSLKTMGEKSFREDDGAIIFYTSGTTGHPKGVMLSHRNFCFSGPNIAQNYGLRESDIAVAVLPLAHVFCVASPFFGSLSSGGSVVVLERFKTEMVFEAIEKYRVTWFPGVPTMFNYLLNGLSANSHDLSSLRMGLSGGASLPIEVLNQWEEKFKASVIEVYGLTESTGLVSGNPVYGVRKAGSIGVTVSGVCAMVVDKRGREAPPREVGELIFKGPNATSGYFNHPQESHDKIKDGWVYTGDHSWRDEEGYFYIVGRENELIISGGYNIYPRELEEVIHGYPGVNEVAVIGVADPIKGEIPKAFVTLKRGSEVKAGDLLDYCKRNLAPYKNPTIVFLDELPKSTTGKIMKKELPRE